jgi:hypothetical protein
MARHSFLLATALAIAWVCACGTSTPLLPTDGSTNDTDPPATCTAIDASACINPMPSYQNQIVPLLDRACNSTCHAPGVGPWPLTDYQDVSDWQTIIFGDVENCTMPPLDAGAGNGSLSDSERAMLLNWLACGAPNN